ncbi:hypothetical protein RFI_03945 [Reticulomyxa filosa]|uniref:Uncharacterized protein n=1 Tax=Reticulomyxa filosa TaxID=46433 RepID=X6P4Z8_RETFI|nr:hypothetical protein RFI_03945 [Reticulomyxa filosa]|eukprot:ETO33159.1 hypothetical protein RFI_03945 [Reticulomyxa filosa]
MGCKLGCPSCFQKFKFWESTDKIVLLSNDSREDHPDFSPLNPNGNSDDSYSMHPYLDNKPRATQTRTLTPLNNEVLRVPLYGGKYLACGYMRQSFADLLHSDAKTEEEKANEIPDNIAICVTNYIGGVHLLGIGDYCILQNLVDLPEYNHLLVQLVAFKEAKKRWRVKIIEFDKNRFQKRFLGVKQENLSPLMNPKAWPAISHPRNVI